jgi:hypothetical protein
VVLHHWIERRGGGPARSVDVLGSGPVRCTVGVVSISREPLGRGRHGGVCIRIRGAAMGERARRGDESLVPADRALRIALCQEPSVGPFAPSPRG